MRWLADENIPGRAVLLMRAMGVDVRAMTELGAGRADAEVLALAKAQGRALISCDRDFGALVYGAGHPPPCAIVYLRLVPASAEAVAQLWARTAAAGDELLLGRFTVVTPEGIRQRALPG